MDLDLNQEPLDSPHGSIFGLGSLLNEIETAHGRIEEHVRQLEAVTLRARQRQRWRQSEIIPQTLNTSAESAATEVHSDDTLVSERIAVASQERTFRTRKIAKSNRTHLVAKALAMDADETKTRSAKGGFFDCNICLDMARDPILTRCGHLFCWPCFYQLSYAHLDVKECPVCWEEVTDTSIIPIYGNGNDDNTLKSRLKDSGLMVPPRPRAHRIDGLRQKLINHRAISSVIDRNIQLFNMIIAMEERSESRNLDDASLMAERAGSLVNESLTSQVSPSMQTADIQHHHHLQVPRLLLQGAASFSSLSSALNSAIDSAERLAEDLEASIRNHHIRRNHQQSSSVAVRDSFSSISSSIQRNSHILDNATNTDSTTAHPASSFRTNDVATVVQLENQRTNTIVESNNVMPFSLSSSRRRVAGSRISEVQNSREANSNVLRSLSSRRRSESPRVSDVDNGMNRESRRRRLM